jgi:hypothetical protein
MFSWLGGLESYGEILFFLGQQLTPLVRETYYNCASRRKFSANEFLTAHIKFPNFTLKKRNLLDIIFVIA